MKPRMRQSLPDGWFMDADIDAYSILYRSIPRGSKTAELGVWKGRSLCSVASLILRRSITVHAVDTFLGTSGELDLVHDCHGRLRQEFETNLVRFRLSKRVHVHTGRSSEVASLFQAHGFHLVFIDADHEEAQVRRDIRTYLPLVSPGGIIAGHDFQRTGVQRAVRAEVGEVLIFPGSSVWAKEL